MMVSDHGFGPCLGRIHVNRILVKAGVARLPGWAGLIERRTFRQATDSGSGARNATTRPLARRRSTSRSPPSIRSTGNVRSPSRLTKTRPRWSTSIAPPVMAA